MKIYLQHEVGNTEFETPELSSITSVLMLKNTSISLKCPSLLSHYKIYGRMLWFLCSLLVFFLALTILND